MKMANSKSTGHSVTAIKIIPLLFLFVSCGNKVMMKENKLESVQPLSTKSYEKSGVLSKGSKVIVLYSGTNYEVSPYSSQAAQDFINSISTGAKINIIFTGGTSGNQIVLETVRQ